MNWQLSGFGDEVDADPVVQVAVLQALGARCIEVRSAWGTNVADLDDAQLAELDRVLRKRGQQVSAVASPVGKVPVEADPDDEVVRLRRNRARRDGARHPVRADLLVLHGGAEARRGA